MNGAVSGLGNVDEACAESPSIYIHAFDSAQREKRRNNGRLVPKPLLVKDILPRS